MDKRAPAFRIKGILPIIGNRQLNISDTYLTTKSTNEKQIILTLSLRVLRALRGYIFHSGFMHNVIIY